MCKHKYTNTEDYFNVFREEKDTINENENIFVLKNFIYWLRETVLDEEDWNLNADAYGEIICRKLKKLGYLELVDHTYRIPKGE